MQFGFKNTFDGHDPALKSGKSSDTFVMVIESIQDKKQPIKKNVDKKDKSDLSSKKYIIIDVRNYFVKSAKLFWSGMDFCSKACGLIAQQLGRLFAQIGAGLSVLGHKTVFMGQKLYGIGCQAVDTLKNLRGNKIEAEVIEPEAMQVPELHNRRAFRFGKPEMRVMWHKTSRKMKKRWHFARTYAQDVKNRPIVAMAATVATATIVLMVLGLNFSIAFEVVVDAKSIAVVHSKKEYQQALNGVNSELASYFGEGSQINKQVAIVPCLVQRNAFSTNEEVKNAIRMLSDKMVDAYMVYMEDKPLFAMSSEEEVAQAVEQFKACYTGGNGEIYAELSKPITIQEQTVPAVMVRTVEGAVNYLNGSEKKDLEYTIQSGDTLWSLSRKFAISMDQLTSMNPELSEDIDIGQKIQVKAYVPIVDVTTVHQAKYNQEIPYETQIIEDATIYKGTTRVDQEGKNGEKTVVANIIKKNGLEVKREELDSQVVAEPVKAIKIVGTKKPPSGYGTGKFIMPTYGTISSRFGPRRGGYHKGLDIAASTGTPIRAADNARVSHAGWQGLFGNLVILDHGNGYQSYYGHCSKLAVKAGQTVNKGDIIAYVGSTGNSSGPHVHFEVYYNGQLKNPENLPYK